MSDEQRVRTMCGWIGVEISKSRKRRADDPEFGLYRVCGWRDTDGDLSVPLIRGSLARENWTAYAFTLEAIEAAVAEAISVGIPAAPADLWLRPRDGGDPVGVTTRWTSRYQGRRDLGVRGGELKWGVGTEACRALSVRVWESMTSEQRQWQRTARMLDRNYLRNKYATQTPRQRQRAQNAEFHAEHLERRKYGLRARYAAKLARDRRTQ